MLKLTRLNNHVVAINPDHISWAEASPDTTLCLVGGEKVIVRESLDELIEQVIHFRRMVRMEFPMAGPEGEPPPPFRPFKAPSRLPSRPVSSAPRGRGEW